MRAWNPAVQVVIYRWLPQNRAHIRRLLPRSYSKWPQQGRMRGPQEQGRR